ncbi:hypothetical protein [Cellulomonas sp.]
MPTLHLATGFDPVTTLLVEHSFSVFWVITLSTPARRREAGGRSPAPAA